jgi:hypothetical protein
MQVMKQVEHQQQGEQVDPEEGELQHEEQGEQPLSARPRRQAAIEADNRRMIRTFDQRHGGANGIPC